MSTQQLRCLYREDGQLDSFRVGDFRAGAIKAPKHK